MVAKTRAGNETLRPSKRGARKGWQRQQTPQREKKGRQDPFSQSENHRI